MCTDKNQSAIKEVRDQLFLDTADGVRLNNISANLGVDRPISGFTDDDWRALVKQIALSPKLIRKIYRKIIEICVGPKFDRLNNLSTAAAIGDTVLNVNDASEFVQLGTVVLDEGLASEETVDFCFADVKTNQLFLNTALTQSHEIVADAQDYLLTDIPAGTTSIVLRDSSDFPISGFPYTIGIGKGTTLEETVTVSGNNTSTNTLTTSATANAHKGFKDEFLRKRLEIAAPAGSVFVTLDLTETREFPENGWIKIGVNTSVNQVWHVSDPGGVPVWTDKTIDFNSVNNADYDVFPATEAVNDYAAWGMTIPFSELSFDSANGTAGVGGVVVWEYWNGSSWVALAGLTDGTVGFTAAVSDNQITSWTIPTDWATTSLNGSPQFYYVRSRITTVYTTNPIYDQGRAGGSELNEIVFFDENSVSSNSLFLKTPLINSYPAGVSVILQSPGAIVETASVRQAGIHWDIFETDPKNIQIFIPPSQVELRLTDASWIHDAVPPAFATTLAVATAVTDTTLSLASVSGLPEVAMLLIDGTQVVFYNFLDENAVPNPTVDITEAIGTVYGIGTSVALYEVPYPVPFEDLEEGNIRNASGDIITDRFTGPYIYDASQRGVSDTTTTTSSIVPKATRLATDQIIIGRTNLEVESLNDWPKGTLPYNIRIGQGSGFEEDISAVDITLTTDIPATTLVNNEIIGSTLIEVTNSGSDAGEFPETSVNLSAGYRIIIDRGGANEEIVTVLDNNGTTTLTTEALTIGHSLGESVELLNDTITTLALTKPHQGPSVNPSRAGDLLEFIVSTINSASTAGFPNNGIIYLNFGKERRSVREKITAVISSTVYEFTDSSIFPTTDFPYEITLGEGLFVEEKVNVSANDTGLNRLTISAAPVNTHIVGEYVEFISGNQEFVSYQDIDGTNFEFIPPITLNTNGHTIGERITLSTDDSVTSADGTSYPFLLPPDFLDCLEIMFELVRAAGVQITLLDNR